MTRKSKFPLVSHGAALLAFLILLFILIVPPRYLFSLTRELRAELTERACRQAIGVFSENLKNLLMQQFVRFVKRRQSTQIA